MSRHSLAIPVFAICGLLTGCASTPPQSISETATDEQVIQAAIDQAWLDFSARFPEADRPEVPRVRVILGTEWPEVMRDCLHEEGFPQVVLTELGDGLRFGGIPVEQDQAFQLARYVCSARYPLDPRMNRPLSPDQLSRLYGFYVGEQLRCIEGLGYEVPDPPTEQTFLETFDSDPWLPFRFAMPQALEKGESALAELMQTCPQQPGDLWD